MIMFDKFVKEFWKALIKRIHINDEGDKDGTYKRTSFGRNIWIFGFSTVFNSCSRELQNLLINLVIEISRYSCNREGYVKNMKETSIRFEKPYLVGRKNQNYCMLTLRPRLNQIVVDVRQTVSLLIQKLLN